MKETLIFFRIRSILKKIETEAAFTKTDMNNEGSVNFLDSRFIEKSIDTEAVFTKTDMNNEGSVNFLENGLLDPQSCRFSMFLTGGTPSENTHLVQIETAQLYFSNLTLGLFFSLGARSGE